MYFDSLFLQQSYNDSWNIYMNGLRGKFPVWDMVIITASNESQAETYRKQIQIRVQGGYLPASTHYAVIPDLNGQRVGSGGATLSAIKYMHDYFGAFASKRCLIIHSGGDSKRIPQYSACGKLFSPAPRQLPDGRRSTLFDEFIISMSCVVPRFGEGILVCSGDVLLLFNSMQIDFYGKGAAALSIKESVETGKDHGVFLKNCENNVAKFLHKQSVETLRSVGAIDERGNVDIDTGAVIMDATMVKSLYSLIDTEEKYLSLVNDRVRLSFYADFLYPLASDSTLEQFYHEKPEGDFTPELYDARTKIWKVLNRYSMKLIRLCPASFIHFGTSRELLSLVTDGLEAFSHLGWQRRVNTNSRSENYAAINSYVSSKAKVGDGSYIEDSYIQEFSSVGKGSIVSGVTLEGQTVPDGVVLHVLKLNDGRYVARMYGVMDNPKEKSVFGIALEQPLWESALYPVRNSIREVVNTVLEFYHAGFSNCSGECLSLKDSFNMADTAAIIDWQNRLNDQIKTKYLLEAIDRREQITEALKVFKGNFSARAENILLNVAEKQNIFDLDGFGRKIRIYYALSKIAKDGDKYEQLCFDTIAKALTGAGKDVFAYSENCRVVKDEVTVQLPIRVNWGGAWSDTPPYCMENGGMVLNAAVALNGKRPIEATARATDVGKVVFSSVDSGISREFTDIRRLQNCSNPYDPFALHKAVLIACGVIPKTGCITLAELTKRMGKGICLETKVVNIPHGSGLGTSSILACACVKAVMELTGRKATDEEISNAVLCVEQLMSTGGGWQDQVGGLVSGVKMVEADAGIYQKVTWETLTLSEKTRKELKERFCLVYTGQRRLARNLLREIVRKYIDGAPEAVESLYHIQQMAVLMKFHLEKGSIDGFAKIMNAHFDAVKRLDDGCTNSCIDQLFYVVDDLIDAKMTCGAGGGGFVQLILKKGVTHDDVRRRIHEVFQDSGAGVWDCELV